MDSQSVANTLDNPIIMMVIFLIILAVIYGFGIIAIDFIKGFNNIDHDNIGDNMTCDSEIMAHNKYLNQ